MHVTGEFEVKLDPIESNTEGVDNIQLGRMSISKEFKGELNAISKGEMLSAVSSIKGSAGYVAIEQVSGELSGKKGSFVLQHFGTMQGSNQNLIIEVVPNSGSDELKGLTGNMKIRIEDGKHYYDFNFELKSE